MLCCYTGLFQDEENSRMSASKRRIQRENEELVEQIDTLNREMASLKSRSASG